MEFGAVSPTVDVFEILLVIALVAGFPLVFLNVKNAWDEREWALDSPDPSFRRLGVARYENARFLFLAMVLLAIGAFSSLLVPSPTLQLATPGIEFEDILNAVLQRIIPALVAACLAYKAFNDNNWRRYVDRRRRLSVTARDAAATEAAVATDAAGLAESSSIEDALATANGKD